MKSLMWQCVVITTLCCLAVQITANPYDSNSKYFPDKYFSPKRTKPSLSIVNPLDVLRQRVMLEMARRQRENAVRQAEANREILKSIGKRGNLDYNDMEEYLKNRYFDTMRLYQQHPNQISGSLEGGNSLNKAEPHQPQPQSQQQLSIVQGLSQNKVNGNKLENKSKLNDPTQEQTYILDDDEDDGNNEATQIKNLYRILSRYPQNDI